VKIQSLKSKLLIHTEAGNGVFKQ